MRITINMTNQEVQDYREATGCSLQHIAKERHKLRMHRMVDDAQSLDDLRNILTTIIDDLY